MHRHEHHRHERQLRSGGHARRAGLFAGGALIIAGVAFLLAQLGLLGGLSAWQLWPVVMMFLGVLKLTQRGNKPGTVEGLLLIAVGCLFQLEYLDYIDLEWRTLWPVGLIALGALVFWTTVHRSRRRPGTSQSESYLDGFVVLGGREESIDAQAFEGGDIFCVMGGFELDLRNARLKDGTAVLNLRVVMGGIELRVPDDWSVVIRGTPIMGGFENKTRASIGGDDAEKQCLIVDGSVIMGGVEIRN